MPNQNYTKIFSEHGRLIGEVRGETFHKGINRNGYLQKPPGIAVDMAALDQAERVGALYIQVQDRDSGVTYRTSIEHLRAKGYQFNRGWGDQISLPCDCWTQRKRGGGLQLALFGNSS